MKIIKTNYSELKAAADSYMILFEFGFFVNINFKSIGTIFSFFLCNQWQHNWTKEKMFQNIMIIMFDWWNSL